MIRSASLKPNKRSRSSAVASPWANPTDEIKPSPRNARTHSDKQIDMIAGSIRQFGCNNPILIDARGFNKLYEPRVRTESRNHR